MNKLRNNNENADDDERALVQSSSTSNDENEQRQPSSVDSEQISSRSERSVVDTMVSRHRYYSRLNPREDSILAVPRGLAEQLGWVFAPPLFDELKSEEGKQHSFVTIFTIWNTMMGTSILSIPWALNQAGIFLGLFLMLVMAAIAFYTAFRVVQSPRDIFKPEPLEFSEVCLLFWGRKGEVMATCFSALVLLGGVIVYWVLMSNFLFHTGQVFREALAPNDTILPLMENKSFRCDFVCVNPEIKIVDNITEVPDTKWWDLQGSVPFYVALLAFPLVNFKSPTFFTKFNILGTCSVMYLFILVTVKALRCGINMSFDPKSFHFAPLASWNFPSLSGTIALSYFIHNAILTILRNQKKPENNVRDLGISFSLVVFTYMYLGVLFYFSFPLSRISDCIAQNFLDNFGSTGDVMSAVARLFLLIQMLAVLPLLLYLIRAQLSYTIFKKIYPGFGCVVALNCIVMAVSITVAVLYPNVGTILRFVGSFCGLLYLFTLPSLVHLKRLTIQNKLTKSQIVVHVTIMVIGVANFLSQFFIT